MLNRCRHRRLPCLGILARHTALLFFNEAPHLIHFYWSELQLGDEKIVELLAVLRYRIRGRADGVQVVMGNSRDAAEAVPLREHTADLRNFLFWKVLAKEWGIDRAHKVSSAVPTFVFLCAIVL